MITRAGRPIAQIQPVPTATGERVKEILRQRPPDRAWERELEELRASLRIEERPWRD